VLLINTSDAGGGAQEIGHRLLDALRRRGHEATLAVGHKQTDDPDVEVIPNWERRTPVARGAAHLGALADRGNRRAGGAIRMAGEPGRAVRTLRGEEDLDHPGTWDLVRREPAPDVIHAHNLHGGYFDLRALPQLSQRAPLLLTLHDMWTFTGHVAHSFDCERWRTGCGDCPYLDVYQAVPRDRTHLNWERKRELYARSRLSVATPSEWLHERVRDSILTAGLAESRVIPNGVDVERFAPGGGQAARRRFGLPDDADVLLFAANSTRSNAFKDFATLERSIEALGGAERARPLIAVSLGEAGATRRLGAAELRMEAHESDPAAIADWYRAADLYVHATRADTFPTTVLEAQASGLPVVASAVGGVPEQVEDGVTGRLVPPGDPTALTAEIERLLEDRARLAAAGAAARERAVERFSAERMVDDYVAWYERLAAN
jgi:glycosyltransferase involved in cell wall biosynthesis